MSYKYATDISFIFVINSAIVHWTRMFVTEERLEIVVTGKNLGFFTHCDSNFDRKYCFLFFFVNLFSYTNK